MPDEKKINVDDLIDEYKAFVETQQPITFDDIKNIFSQIEKPKFGNMNTQQMLILMKTGNAIDKYLAIKDPNLKKTDKLKQLQKELNRKKSVINLYRKISRYPDILKVSSKGLTQVSLITSNIETFKKIYDFQSNSFQECLERITEKELNNDEVESFSDYLSRFSPSEFRARLIRNRVSHLDDSQDISQFLKEHIQTLSEKTTKSILEYLQNESSPDLKEVKRLLNYSESGNSSKKTDSLKKKFKEALFKNIDKIIKAKELPPDDKLSLLKTLAKKLEKSISSIQPDQENS